VSNPVAVLRHEVEYTTGKVLGDSLWMWCPACDAAKCIPVNRSGGTFWVWDGNLEAPTLSPSILQHSGSTLPLCHSFLKGGVWDFLSDCTHSMAGQKVPMVPVPDWLMSDGSG
jgi:hypothetical protein